MERWSIFYKSRSRVVALVQGSGRGSPPRIFVPYTTGQALDFLKRKSERCLPVAGASKSAKWSLVGFAPVSIDTLRMLHESEREDR